MQGKLQQLAFLKDEIAVRFQIFIVSHSKIDAVVRKVHKSNIYGKSE